MKIMRYVYGLLLSLPFFVSCSETEGILETNDVPYWKRDLVIEATREGNESDTRTTLQEDGSVLWNPADEISLFFMRGENGGYKFTSQNTELAEVAEFSGSISGITGGGENLTDDAYFWAIYPYSKENACENNSLIARLPNQQPSVAGTVADDLILTVARSMNVKMGFKNVCGGLELRVSQSGIKSISIRGNSDEDLAGKVRIEFNESNIPVVTEVIDGQKEITLLAPNGGEFEVGKLYYLVAFPKALEGGFTMTFRKTDGTCGVYSRTKAAAFNRSRFSRAYDLDAGLTFYEEEESGETVTGGSESGFYLGIIGFNVDLYPYPIRKLTEESVAGFHSFIDGLSMLKGTLLYYAVDNSLDALLASTYPSNLYDVAVVTFTDGLDLISIDRVEIDKGIVYLSRDEYLEAIHTRLNEEKVSGQSITAYSIGVEGNDVTNSSLFQKNLEKIATSSDNAFKVTNMSEVAEKFTEIANQLGETKYVQTITLRASAPDNQERVRFTFDNVSSYSSSKLYIEGTFNRAANPRTLENITYVGLTSTSGSTITCPRDAQGFYEFTFEGVQANNGELVPDDYQQRWYTTSGIWEFDSEFDPAQSDWTTQTVKRSAAILLNLDCSSSLGTEFPKLQAAAKSFVSLLYENSIDPNAVASISLNKSTLTMVTGNVETLTATVLPTTALDTRVEWSSTNTAAATVDQNGVVTAVGPGNATIIAKTVDGGLTATCKVSVVTLAQEITFDCTELEIYNGESYTLQATVLPEDTSNKSLSWASSNTAVATVDENGTITPVKAGTTTITATSMDGTGIKCSCQVTVLQRSESITLDAESAFLYIGDKKQLTATILPADATNQKVVWSSSDDTIASVDQEGLVTALKVGKVQITATAEEGALKAVCEVEVAAFVSGIKFDKNELELYNGDTYTLQASILPEDANNKTLSWSSSSPTIATVDENGTITAITAGTATITATATDESGITATCKVTVLQHVESVSFSSGAGHIYTGIPTLVTATVLPENASNKKLLWRSSDESIATVTSYDDVRCRVLGLKEGIVTITAISEDGELTASTTLYVHLSVTSVELNMTEATLYTNDVLQLVATIQPEEAEYTAIWKSSNPSVASVDSSGLVTALSLGTATITLQVPDGYGNLGFEVSCVVTVKQHVESVSLDQINRPLNVGESYQLSANITPSDATNKNVTWESSDPMVATVSSSGLVKALNSGSTTITVTTEDGEFTATSRIDVMQYVSNITLDSNSVTIYENESWKLNASVGPENADNKIVVWESSNPTVAAVDQNGLVSALSVGTTTITATAQDGSGVSASCIFTVNKHVEDISLSSSSVDITMGNTFTLTASVTPSDATNKKYSATSSNTAVATVSINGSSVIIRSVGLGSTTITVTTEDGEYTATCDVNVVLSKTPTNLALVVKKSGVRYYVPTSIYGSTNLTGYTKEGIAIVYGSTSFILALNDASTSALTFTEANALGTLPSSTQANAIVAYWSSINSALTTFGGTSMGAKSYWTSTSGASRAAYYYSQSTVAQAVSTRNYYARKVIATL